jgi:hypothetical protein
MLGSNAPEADSAFFLIDRSGLEVSNNGFECTVHTQKNDVLYYERLSIIPSVRNHYDLVT